MDLLSEITGVSYSFSVPDGYSEVRSSYIRNHAKPLAPEDLTDFAPVIPDNFSDEERKLSEDMLESCVIKEISDTVLCLRIVSDCEDNNIPFSYKLVELICDYTQIVRDGYDGSIKAFLPMEISDVSFEFKNDYPDNSLQ
ncbi:MAG: hypothetical protein ACI4NM_07555 [Bullifex sp.]